ETGPQPGSRQTNILWQTETLHAEFVTCVLPFGSASVVRPRSTRHEARFRGKLRRSMRAVRYVGFAGFLFMLDLHARAPLSDEVVLGMGGVQSSPKRLGLLTVGCGLLLLPGRTERV